MTDKQIEYLNDAIDRAHISSCCGAPIYLPDICSDCKEHCGLEEPWGINLGNELAGGVE